MDFAFPSHISLNHRIITPKLSLQLMQSRLFNVDTALVASRTVARRFREQEGDALYDLIQDNHSRLEDHFPKTMEMIRDKEHAEFFVRKMLASWLILVAVLDFAFFNFSTFAGQSVTIWHELGLLLVAVLGAALWVFTGSEERRITVHLHSTQLISGVLFVLLAVLMLNGALTQINALFGQYEFSEWFVLLEERFVSFFQQ